MDHQDAVTFLIFTMGAVIILIGWLWRHSSRLTRAEVMIENNISNIRDASLRSDLQMADIRTCLHRIEDKMDRSFAGRRDGGL